MDGWPLGGAMSLPSADGPPRAPKRPKLLGEDEVWRPSGERVNVIEADGRACTHEARARRGRDPRRAGGARQRATKSERPAPGGRHAAGQTPLNGSEPARRR
jgi:hypothetical protein